MTGRRKNHCRVILSALQLKKKIASDLGKVPETLHMFSYLVTQLIPSRSPGLYTHVAKNNKSQDSFWMKSRGQRPCAHLQNSPTSVTASMEAPVFSSSSMTRMWFFLQAICKGVKPFCSPAHRETDKQELTTLAQGAPRLPISDSQWPDHR